MSSESERRLKKHRRKGRKLAWQLLNVAVELRQVRLRIISAAKSGRLELKDCNAYVELKSHGLNWVSDLLELGVRLGAQPWLPRTETPTEQTPPVATKAPSPAQESPPS